MPSSSTTVSIVSVGQMLWRSRPECAQGWQHLKAIQRNNLEQRQPVGEATAHRSDINTDCNWRLPRVITKSGALHANRLRLLSAFGNNDHPVQRHIHLPPKADMCSATRNSAMCRIADIAAYSITSSICIKSDSGNSMPSALAVSRLTTSSNLVGFCTGRSAAFAPLSMRST